MATAATHDMALTRTLDAPVEDVWRAWTEPDAFMGWWGPAGFTAPLAEMDVREGGTSLICMRAPAEFGGQDFYNTWTYSRIVPNERLEFVQAFTDRERTAHDPADLGLPPGIPARVPHVVTFRPLAEGRTELSVTESGYPSEDVAAISRGGMEQCLDKLAAWLGGSRSASGE
jgi:uncharacterized protein YndB with AHSA1/START domain